jgi:transcriptional regulator with XRE-family HTH domain
MDELVKGIRELQKEKGLSDRQLAILLEIDPGYWSKISRGLAPPNGGKFLKAVAREFPELQNKILQSMTDR